MTRLIEFSYRVLGVLLRSARQSFWSIRSFAGPSDVWFALRSMYRWHLTGRRGDRAGTFRDMALRTGRIFRIRPWTSDFEVLRKVLLGDQYAAVLNLLPQGPLILDFGANIGASARLFLERFPDAIVIAVEPDRENLELLEFNVREFGSRCVIAGCAVSGEGGIAQAEFADQPWAHKFTGVQNSGDALSAKGTVRARSVLEILADSGFADAMIDLVKCDIEGAERDLFKHRSASDWLCRVRWLSVELHDAYALNEFLDDLRRHGCTPRLVESRVLGSDAEVTVELTRR